MMLFGGFAGLQAVVAGARYKPGWSFRLEEERTTSAGTCIDPDVVGQPVTAATMAAPILIWPLRAVIILRTPDSDHPDRMITVCHRFPVPPVEWPELTWQEWLLRRIVDVETHEACENFRVHGERPFYPAHEPGAGLYAIRAAVRG